MAPRSASVLVAGMLLLSQPLQDAPFRAYQNFDFVPGQQVLFEDDFRGDKDGEFAAHWELVNGQGVVNQVDGAPAFLLTEGSYAMVAPRMKTERYLTDAFTVEFDYMVRPDGNHPIVALVDTEGTERHILFAMSATTGYFDQELRGTEVLTEEDYHGKWHHAALVYRAGQLKAYIDHGRSLVVPRVGFTPVSLRIGGIGSTEAPVMFRNVRIAAGGDMNPVSRITTDARYVARGIRFDYNSAKLRAESMGELNGIAKAMKENAALRFEIGGHTDSDGDDASNLRLSQQRADAVRTALMTLGIDPGRLVAKGYGESKPLADNSTPEGKANNRRVEFVKL